MIAFGGTGVVYAIDERTVLKEYYDENNDDFVAECNAFERLGQHANIVKYISQHNNKSIILERGTPLLTVIRPADTATATLGQKLQWIRDIAQGLRHAHNKEIVHADIGCSNIVIVGNRAKLIDFGGCSMDGSEALSIYNWYSRRGTKVVSKETDIFAYGCTVYEILTGRTPYHEFEHCADRHIRVPQLYVQGSFPDVTELPLSELMLGCWHGTLRSMDDIIALLDRLHGRQSLGSNKMP